MRAATEVVVVEVPHVAHGREAIADVRRTGGGTSALGHAVAGGQHEVVPAQVERLDRSGEQRQVLAIAGGGRGQALNKRGDDAPALDERRHAARHVEQGEEIGLGEQLAEHLETALAPAHAREPIVNQSDFHRCSLAMTW